MEVSRGEEVGAVAVREQTRGELQADEDACAQVWRSLMLYVYTFRCSRPSSCATAARHPSSSLAKLVS